MLIAILRHMNTRQVCQIYEASPQPSGSCALETGKFQLAVHGWFKTMLVYYLGPK